MSRAFVKEDGPDTSPLPDLPISPHPNFVTPEGLARLQSRLADRQAELDALRLRSDRLDRMPEKAADRDIRYLEARLRSAILIDPATHPPGTVAFGHRVTVEDDAGQTRVWQIVGEDEADGTAGKITAQSPLAKALLGSQPGDVVTWRTPAGPREVAVTAIN